ncbi:MAG: 16S rRNA (cytidine(1402)-2'-O)-methyltransferase [Pseudomonadota bacterium]
MPDRPFNLSGLLSNALAQPMAPGLYVVATPIGNLADLSIRAASILARADHVYCEDTRMTRRLMQAIGVDRPLRSYHDHSDEARRHEIEALISNGQTVALVSDAGTPLISDPGYKLVRDVRAQGAPVLAIPGPSSVTAALASSGLPTHTVLFAGFLPQKSAARIDRLAELAEVRASLVFFESPKRLRAMLGDAARVLGDRQAAVCRELTKKFETVVSAPLSEISAVLAEGIKGEIVVVIGPPEPVAPGIIADADIVARLQPLLETKSVSAASKEVAVALGVPKARVYALAVDAKSGGALGDTDDRSS